MDFSIDSSFGGFTVLVIAIAALAATIVLVFLATAARQARETVLDEDEDAPKV